MWIRTVMLAASVALTLAGNAAAQSPAPPPGTPVVLPPLGPAISPLPDRTQVGTLSAGHPCNGQTDNPHNSKHYPGYAIVSSRTMCAPHSATVTVYLFREVFGAWYFLDAGGPVTKVGTAQTNARWKCPDGSKQHFRGDGYHSAVSHVSTTTTNQRTFTCN
jgi:hypothetical protein